MKLAISTMTNNQSSRLYEWIDYHNKIGFNKFIIYLDNCTDDSFTVLNNIKNIDIDIYKTENIDENYKDPNWISRSHRMYNHTLLNYNNYDWVGFIEVDEFLFPQSNLTLIEFLDSLNSDCLYINSWDFKGPFNLNLPILGQSNLIWTNEQRFNSEYRFRGKSIIKPHRFKYCVDAHHFAYNDNVVSNEFKINRDNLIQIHYGNQVTIDDNKFKIYHFRNHTPSNMNNYEEIIYL